jgi:hypothetical protein
MRDLGFDRAGRLFGLTLQSLTEAELERGEALVDGKPVRLEKPLDGVPVLAHAFVLESRHWHRVETVNSTDAWDLALGVKGLAAAQGLGFRSAETLAPQVQGDEENDGALLARLARFAPQLAGLTRGDGGWIRDGWGDTRFVLWEEHGEFGYSTGLAAFVDRNGNLHPPAEWPFSEKIRICYRWNGPYLLVAEGYNGARPRLYRDGKLVWSSSTALATTFWPGARLANADRHE